ncbi:DUF2786 domain-containing protein [Streptomyces sp. NPDC099050]|uniref:DUF2786 domain-containing protein n=1 Tax=Streptomyces sp. NPDC099050 TaxID=3366100 RepID=UPI00382E18FA
MTDGGTGGTPEQEFRWARADWLRGRVEDLAAVLEDAGPDLYKLLPADLGDQRLAAAVTAARLAADEARTQSVADSVRWLERLIPGGHLHGLESAVREFRSALSAQGEPAFWSWNAEGWEEMLLWWWRRQTGAGSPDRDLTEWRARWSADIPGVGFIDHPAWAPRRHDRLLVTTGEFFAQEAEPLRLLAQAVLEQSDTSGAAQDAVLLREEHLQGAGHLEWLAEQQASADRLDAWCKEQQASASEATLGFLAEFAEVVERYSSLVIQPVIDALSECERAVFTESATGARRSAADYLSAYLEAGERSGKELWDDDSLSPDVAEQARDHGSRGELTWHGMRGSVPVWYHVVTSREERAAAIAYSGQPSESVVRVRTGTEWPAKQASLFDDAWGEEEDWYPKPGIEIHYAEDSAVDACEVLALAQLGHARLEFLIQKPDGGYQRLRSVRASIDAGDTGAWRRWALGVLAGLVPDPEDLADAIAQEEGGSREESPEGAPGSPEDRPSPERGAGVPGPRPPRDGLPEALLGKVRALLRKAESSGAGEEEARTYLDKATELMAKYGIERAMLDDAGEKVRPVDRVVGLHPPYVKEVSRLLSGIGHAMRCRTVHLSDKTGNHRVHLFGYEADVQAAEMLFASLRLQMLAGADQADRRYRPAGEDARAYKRSWMLGFIREVFVRVNTAQQAASTAAEQDSEPGAGHEADGRSVALVLADRTNVVEATLAARYPKLKKLSPTKSKGTGYRQGIADGRYADIGRPAFGEDDDWYV